MNNGIVGIKLTMEDGLNISYGDWVSVIESSVISSIICFGGGAVNSTPSSMRASGRLCPDEPKSSPVVAAATLPINS